MHSRPAYFTQWVPGKQGLQRMSAKKKKKKKPQKIVCVWLRYDKTLLSSKIQ